MFCCIMPTCWQRGGSEVDESFIQPLWKAVSAVLKFYPLEQKKRAMVLPGAISAGRGGLHRGVEAAAGQRAHFEQPVRAMRNARNT